MNLQALRNSIRDRRKQLSPDVVSHASESIAQKIKLLPEFVDAECIALYVSNESEVDPVGILDAALQAHKKTYLPVLKRKILYFCRVDKNTQYIKNRFDILEPVYTEHDLVAVDQLDLLLMPLVAFDAQCHRVGRGGGYYDRTLVVRKKSASLIGLAYEFQKVDHIVPQPWDISMNKIITEKTVYIA